MKQEDGKVKKYLLQLNRSWESPPSAKPHDCRQPFSQHCKENHSANVPRAMQKHGGEKKKHDIIVTNSVVAPSTLAVRTVGNQQAYKSALDAYRSTFSTYKSVTDAYKAATDAYKSPSDPYKSPSEPYKSSDPYKSPSEPYKSPSDPFKSPSDPYKSLGDSYKSPTETYRSPKNAYKSPSETFRSPKDVYKSPTESFRSPKDAYKSPTESFRSPKDAYRSPTDAYESSADAYIPTTMPYKSTSNSFKSTATSYKSSSMVLKLKSTDDSYKCVSDSFKPVTESYKCKSDPYTSVVPNKLYKCDSLSKCRCPSEIPPPPLRERYESPRGEFPKVDVYSRNEDIVKHSWSRGTDIPITHVKPPTAEKTSEHHTTRKTKVPQEEEPGCECGAGHASSESCTGAMKSPIPSEGEVNEMQLQLDGEQEGMKAVKRERNRLAARRCRQNQRDRIGILERDVRDMESANGLVQKEIELLQDQARQLSSMLMNHKCVLKPPPTTTPAHNKQHEPANPR